MLRGFSSARPQTRALGEGFAYPAINVTSSQTLNGTLRGLADAGSDGIVQVTVGGASYLGGGDALAGARAFAAMTRELAAPLDVLIGVHTDHAPPDSVDGFLRPLLAGSAARREAGEPPLFNSHMFDGSTLPLEENLGLSSELLGLAAAADVVLEVEVGVVGGEEDGVRGPDGDRARLYTTTDDLLHTAEVLGTGERGRYLLAATFGNVDVQYAFTRAIAGHVLANYDGVLKVDGGLGRKADYDPRSWGAKAEAALAAHVAGAAALFGSAGRSLLRG